MGGVLSEDEVAKRYHKKRETIRDWRKHRKGPPYFKAGDTVFYREEALLEWERQQEQAAASA